MAKRIFIAFAVEDELFRDFVVGQSRNRSTPFEFVDMSVKKPWDREWRVHARARIKGCDGMIALISKHTPAATGEIFEMQCAVDERIPLMLMYINDDRPTLPEVIKYKRKNIWSWSNLDSFVNSL